MKILQMLLLLSLCSSATVNAEAQNPFSFQPSFRQSGDIVIPTGNVPETRTVRFPALERHPGNGAVLYFRPYLKTGKANGWNNYLTLRLNGKLLAQYTEDGFPRLLRRGESMGNTFRDKWPWWRNNAWLVYFNNGKSDLDPRITSHREEKYDYFYDISDAVHFIRKGADDRIEDARENVLEITNHFVRKLGGKELRDTVLCIDGLSVGHVPEGELSKDRAAGTKLTECIPAPAAGKFRIGKAEAAVTCGGDLMITYGADRYFLESAFSYPGNPVMKYNKFSAGKASGEQGWNPAVTGRDGEYRITARGKNYRIERRIIPGKAGIRVLDKITNTSAENQGFHIRYDLIQPELISSKAFRLAGLNDYRRQEEVMANPSLFLGRKSSSVGMTADDDTLRLQISLSNLGNLLRMETVNFGLRPGESETLERTIYPVSSGHYFDFINLVRRDKKLNRTVEGPFVFEDSVIPDSLDCSIIVAGPWFKYGWGAHIPVPEYKKIMTKRLAELRKKRPGVKVLPRMETDLITLDKRKIKNGDKLPKSSRLTGRYGTVLTPEQTRILLEDPAAGKYADSMMFTADNRLIVDTYYPPEPYIDLIVRPAGNNYRTREMLSEIDFMLNELGCDGVYLDQFEPQAPLGSLDSRCSYNRWDGRTVKLAPDGTIAAKYYDYALAGVKDRVRILNHVLTRGKTVVGNSRPVTDSTNRLGIRFSEIETDAPESYLLRRDRPLTGKRQTLGHLAGTPVILGVRPERFISKDGPDLRAAALTRGIITALRNGQLYYYYGHQMPLNGKLGGGYGPCNHMYPFTPVELNEGYLTGRERIITCVSRRFTFEPKKTDPLILLFDRQGREKAHSFRIDKKEKEWSIDIRLNDWNEIAIIDFTRKPLRYKETPLSALDAKAWHGRPLKKVTENGETYFTVTAPFELKTFQNIPVAPAKKYRLSGKFRCASGKLEQPLYFGLVPFTADNRFITAASINPVSGKPTAKLAESVKAGDKIVKLRNADGWTLDRSSCLLAFHARTDKSDLPNFDLSSYLTKIKKTEDGYAVELAAPLRKGYEEGTVVRLHFDASTFIYAGASWSSPRLTSQWTEFKGTVQGISEGITTTHWRPGTAKTGIVFFCQQPDAEIHLKDIRLEEEE